MNKRIIVRYGQGAFRDLWQILGTDDQLKEGLKVEHLPVRLGPVQLLDHVATVEMDRVRPRYILYRETIGNLGVESPPSTGPETASG